MKACDGDAKRLKKLAGSRADLFFERFCFELLGYDIEDLDGYRRLEMIRYEGFFLANGKDVLAYFLRVHPPGKHPLDSHLRSVASEEVLTRQVCGLVLNRNLLYYFDIKRSVQMEASSPDPVLWSDVTSWLTKGEYHSIFPWVTHEPEFGQRYEIDEKLNEFIEHGGPPGV